MKNKGKRKKYQEDLTVADYLFGKGTSCNFKFMAIIIAVVICVLGISLAFIMGGAEIKALIIEAVRRSYNYFKK